MDAKQYILDEIQESGIEKPILVTNDRMYSHIVLKEDKSRGPITDLVIGSGL